MITVVYGCFRCAGEEHPYYTCTILYRDPEGSPKLHWLCRQCVQQLDPGKLTLGLTHHDKHPQAQETFDGTSPTRQVETITFGLPTEGQNCNPSTYLAE